jgi:hypothetical protein
MRSGKSTAHPKIDPDGPLPFLNILKITRARDAAEFAGEISR